MVDDSIYRDLYAASDWIHAWWAFVWPLLRTENALRIYAASTCLALFSASYYKASRTKRDIMKMLGNHKHKAFRGRPPSQIRTVLARISQITNRTLNSARSFVASFISLSVYGILVPSIIFVGVLLNYTWFDPASSAFLSGPEGDVISNISFNQAVAFVFDQITHSLFLDVPEVFGLNSTPLVNNPENTVFSTLVILFRLSVVGSAVFLYTSIKSSIPLLFKLYRQDREDISKLRAQSKA